jgi:GTP-binding protein
MQVNNVRLEAVGVKFEQFPESGYPEVAFAGRSNVGKSSLINALINRKALARTSGQPGKTQTINFYNVEEQLYFVDLPGYGYAKVARASREQWGKMIEYYLNRRVPLGMIILLVDIRHTPNENDRIMMDYIRTAGFEPLVVATKADKLNRSQIIKHLKIIKQALALQSTNQIVPFSSMTKQGAEAIWDEVDQWLAYVKEQKELEDSEFEDEDTDIEED